MTRKDFGISCLLLLICGLAAAGCSRSGSVGPVADRQAAQEIRTALVGDSSAAGGQPAAAPVGTGWATLTGRFVFEGTPPVMPPYNVTKDHAICAPGGRAPLQEMLVVGSDGGIQNVAVYLRNASRVHESAQLAAPGAAEPAVFDQRVCQFLSHVFPAVVGQTVVLKNSDNTPHNTNIAGSNSFNQTIAAMQGVNFLPGREEQRPVDVSCSIHPWMRAHMLFRKDGYAAVTAADGTFEIANLPAGEELEIQVWHESALSNDGFLVLTSPQARELNWSNRGRFKIRLEEGERRDLGNIVVPSSAFRL